MPALGLTERSPTPDEGAAIPRQDVIDLTAKMHAGRKPRLDAAAGRWVIVRIGYSLLGVANHPAPLEATGLEVDKLNHAYVKDYLDTYLGQYAQATKGLMGQHGIRRLPTTAGKTVLRTGPTTCWTSSRSGAATIRVPGFRY